MGRPGQPGRRAGTSQPETDGQAGDADARRTVSTVRRRIPHEHLDGEPEPDLMPSGGRSGGGTVRRTSVWRAGRSDRITWAGTPSPASGRRRARQHRGNARLGHRRRTGGTTDRDGFRVSGCAAQQGSRDGEPHGRVWLKKVTGSGGAQAVTVVGNGRGGPKRVWNPAARRDVGAPEQSGASQAVSRINATYLPGSRREVDSPD